MSTSAILGRLQQPSFWTIRARQLSDNVRWRPARSSMPTSAIFGRLQSTNIYSKLLIRRCGQVRGVKAAKSRWVPVAISNMSPAFTAEKLRLEAPANPGDGEAVYLVDLCETTEVNRKKGDRTFLYRFAILRAYPWGNPIGRCQVQGITTRSTAVGDVSGVEGHLAALSLVGIEGCLEESHGTISFSNAWYHPMRRKE